MDGWISILLYLINLIKAFVHDTHILRCKHLDLVYFIFHRPLTQVRIKASGLCTTIITKENQRSPWGWRTAAAQTGGRRPSLGACSGWASAQRCQTHRQSPTASPLSGWVQGSDWEFRPSSADPEADMSGVVGFLITGWLGEKKNRIKKNRGFALIIIIVEFQDFTLDSLQGRNIYINFIILLE